MRRRTFLTTLAAVPLTIAGAMTLRRNVSAATPMSGAVDEIRSSWRTLVAKNADVATSTDPLSRSNTEWKKVLSPQQYDVLREEGTERPGSSPLNNEKRAGVYVCAGCALPLFTSRMKFDSGTGWPSFFTSIPDHLAMKKDFKIIVERDEYHCVRCGGHQGHVFDDGPPPTRQRWCNNGVALRFIPA
ncbi:MAG TPA: peptide-methionine (R)-S-oxide reductase MsrB [Casimicrobiaceae bacterium]|nr:peptide-methionine (R)-S-oxide reductase MsrB [Casimicrobiaceae bacterium]